MGINLEKLKWDLLFRIREEANRIVSLKSGTAGVIAIYLVSKSDFSSNFLGLPCDKTSINRDIVILEPIVPGGPKTNDYADFAGLAIMQTEASCQAVSGRYGRRSSDVPAVIAKKGTLNKVGGVCFDIACDSKAETASYFGTKEKCFDFDAFVVMRVYATVIIDGADEKTNELCSLATGYALSRFITDQPKLFVIAPEEPDGCHIVINEWNCYGYKDCKRCNCHGETCVDACPTGALYFSEMDNKVITRDNLCTGCNRCATAGCPYGSVNIFTSKRLADISKAAWSR